MSGSATVCMYVFTCMYGWLAGWLDGWMFICVRVYVRMYVCMYVCMYVLCIRVCIHVCACIYAYNYVPNYVCMQMCTYACVHACMHLCIIMYRISALVRRCIECLATPNLREHIVPHSRTATRQHCAFSVAGPVTWNGLQIPVHHSTSFLSALKNVMFDRGWAGSASEKAILM